MRYSYNKCVFENLNVGNEEGFDLKYVRKMRQTHRTKNILSILVLTRISCSRTRARGKKEVLRLLCMHGFDNNKYLFLEHLTQPIKASSRCLNSHTSTHLSVTIKYILQIHHHSNHNHSVSLSLSLSHTHTQTG